MSHEIVEHKQTLKEIQNVSKIFRTSGMFPTVDSEAKAIVKVMAGQELGFPPVYSMMKIHMFNGQISLSADVMGSLIKRSGDHTYFIREHNQRICKLEFKQLISGKWETLGDSTYTIEEAKTAGLSGKDNWKKHPKNMLFARAISNGARWFCPHLISGAYTQDEVEEFEPVKVSEGPVNITPEPEVMPEPEQDDVIDVGASIEDRCKVLVDMISTNADSKRSFFQEIDSKGKCTVGALKKFDVDSSMLDEVESALGVGEGE